MLNFVMNGHKNNVFCSSLLCFTLFPLQVQTILINYLLIKVADAERATRKVEEPFQSQPNHQTFNEMKFSRFIQLSFFFLLVLGTSNELQAQKSKADRPSPPAVAKGASGPLTVAVDYSSPAVKNRQVLGKLIPNGKIWRLGANEATTFEVNQDVLVEGKPLAAGKYAMFSIQDGGDWTIIFNKDAEQWGAYKYKESEDALRVVIKPGTSTDMAERMTFAVKEVKTGALDVVFNWDKIEWHLDVKAAK